MYRSSTMIRSTNIFHIRSPSQRVWVCRRSVLPVRQSYPSIRLITPLNWITTSMRGQNPPHPEHLLTYVFSTVLKHWRRRLRQHSISCPFAQLSGLCSSLASNSTLRSLRPSVFSIDSSANGKRNSDANISERMVA